MKKIIYGLIGLIIIGVFVYLIYFRLNNKPIDKSFVSQIIVPVAKTGASNTKDSELGQATNDINSTIVNLDFGDVFITEIDTDLDLDGFDDKVVAFRRNTDNSLYLAPAFQNPISKSYALSEPIKLEISQVNTISIYTLDLGLEARPAIVCSGTAIDNTQVLSIFLVETITTTPQPILTQVAVFHADVQIRITKNERAQNVGFNMYTISCFETDMSMPNTLAQIEKIYTWSDTERVFKKDSERVIPGERVENQMLQRIGSGNMTLFREFLQGLWTHNNNMNSPEEKLMYFDDAENEITFTNGELQEIYVISNVVQRRYGLYFTTYNKSLSNIILRVDIEIKSLNEVTVHVVESVTRLKIGAESLWDGIYRKKDDSITRETKQVTTSDIEAALRRENVVWKNESYELKISDGNFSFHTPFGLQSGDFTIVNIQGKTILQIKDKNLKTFYEVSFKNDNLVLSEVNIKINTVQNIGAPDIVLAPISE